MGCLVSLLGEFLVRYLILYKEKRSTLTGSHLLRFLDLDVGEGLHVVVTKLPQTIFTKQLTFYIGFTLTSMSVTFYGYRNVYITNHLKEIKRN